MKKALVFGAGNIGRGFLGVLLHQSGYATTFADVDAAKVALLNQHGAYPVYVCSKGGITEQAVSGVDAVSVRDSEAITSAICNADIILTAVGKVALEGAAEVLAKGLMERARVRPASELPIVVIACENVQDNTAYLAGLTKQRLPTEYRKKLDAVSFPNCIVDRIVPSVLPASAQGHPLAVAVEDYYQFVVDATQLRMDFPAIQGVELVEGVSAKLEQKLFTLNMAHGIVGYYGKLKGYEFVHEAIGDPTILQLLQGALREVEELMVKRHPAITRNDQQSYSARVVDRFGNPYLRDSLLRVASQPKRKLAGNERLVRPARLLWQLGQIPAHLATGIASAFHFNNPADKQAAELQAELQAQGIEAVLQKVAGLAPKHNLAQLVRADFLLGALAR